jgi:hypothetical protein
MDFDQLCVVLVRPFPNTLAQLHLQTEKRLRLARSLLFYLARFRFYEWMLK